VTKKRGAQARMRRPRFTCTLILNDASKPDTPKNGSQNRSFAGRTVHCQKLINKSAFGFHEVVALQLVGISKTGHPKEWFSELALSLKNRSYLV
jgi:hypothetical protein